MSKVGNRAANRPTVARQTAQDRAGAWLRDHAREYPGQFLLLSGDRLLASGASLQRVLDAADAEPPGTPLLLVFQPHPFHPADAPALRRRRRAPEADTDNPTPGEFPP